MTYLLNKIYPEKERLYRKMFEVMPVAFKPTVTLQNVEDKYLDRYFVQLANDKDYIVEVNAQQFEMLKSNPRFVTVSVRWKIVGVTGTVTRDDGTIEWGVSEINKQIIASADLTMKGLKKYITNYLEFWQFEK
jgi:hypothetical protein